MCKVLYATHRQGPQMRQYELEELTKIYEERGLPAALAKEVAMHLTKNDGEWPHYAHERQPATRLRQQHIRCSAHTFRSPNVRITLHCASAVVHGDGSLLPTLHSSQLQNWFCLLALFHLAVPSLQYWRRMLGTSWASIPMTWQTQCR